MAITSVRALAITEHNSAQTAMPTTFNIEQENNLCSFEGEDLAPQSICNVFPTSNIEHGIAAFKQIKLQVLFHVLQRERCIFLGSHC